MCAVVRFTKSKLGAGIQQSIVFFEEGGQTKFVPCIECNRFETIDRVVREFLTPAEGVIEVVNGETSNIQHPTGLRPAATARQASDAQGNSGTRGTRPSEIREQPMMLLPRMRAGDSAILETVEAHLIAGSERVKAGDGSQGDYVDACENHLLLADGYSKLAEIICAGNRPVRFAYERVEMKGGVEGRGRGKGGLI